ncbi:MAG: hypothetical protein GVY08_14330 [Bacteroidetes bacterium]|nr:hypothetical protein [Bacteroidota bacterium]
MIQNKQIIGLIGLVMLLAFAGIANAQDENERQILSLTEFTIKPGHTSAFQEGVKSWKECYLDNEGTWTWNVWDRMNGKGSVYLLTSYTSSWAEMDEDDEAGQMCAPIVLQLIMPNVEVAENQYFYTMPDWSPTPSGEQSNFVEVAYFKISHYDRFVDLVTGVTGIIEDVEGDKRSSWYDSYGRSPGQFHYMSVVGHDSLASLDNPETNIWEVIIDAEGEDRRDELVDLYYQSVEESWMYMYRRMEDMSYSGTE